MQPASLMVHIAHAPTSSGQLVNSTQPHHCAGTRYFDCRQTSSTRSTYPNLGSVLSSSSQSSNQTLISDQSEHWNLVRGKFLFARYIRHIKTSFMSELDIQTPTAFDPFADANAENSGAGSKDYIHIRIQQRNGRKSLTTVQGLKKEFSYNKILKDLKKEFCCNGTVVQDPELGQVIQLQGDQRKNVSTFLVQAGIAKKEHIKIHGF
ncbi:protein translation factor SUI1 [Sesamum angolense]|uniref:Protein translation factor SUI1 n=4 Tax=Sesamum TaxID=4181 RepID=A0AAE2BUY4_9LAMI|nr:protein translation factor SUI1 [Sesamum angolense]